MIEIANLKKSFGATRVLDGVSLRIPDREMFGLVGVSGAGKSTLLRCINGLEPFEEGSISVDGCSVGDLNARELNAFRAKIGMIFQQYSLLERKTVAQNIDFALKCHNVSKRERKARISELLELVGLADKADAKPRELSGGQKQRVAIARAISTNPKVLLCDEATSALDPNISASVLDLLASLNGELGITVVVVTHQMQVVKRVCKSAAVLKRGKIVYDGPADALFLEHADVLDDIAGEAGGRAPRPGERAYVLVQTGAAEDALSRLALAFDKPFRVLWGGLDRYRDQVKGSFTVAVARDDERAFEACLQKLPDVEWSRCANAAAPEKES